MRGVSPERRGECRFYFQEIKPHLALSESVLQDLSPRVGMLCDQLSCIDGVKEWTVVSLPCAPRPLLRRTHTYKLIHTKPSGMILRAHMKALSLSLSLSLSVSFSLSLSVSLLLRFYEGLPPSVVTTPVLSTIPESRRRISPTFADSTRAQGDIYIYILYIYCSASSPFFTATAIAPEAYPVSQLLCFRGSIAQISSSTLLYTSHSVISLSF